MGKVHGAGEDTGSGQIWGKDQEAGETVRIKFGWLISEGPSGFLGSEWLSLVKNSVWSSVSAASGSFRSLP